MSTIMTYVSNLKAKTVIPKVLTFLREYLLTPRTTLYYVHYLFTVPNTISEFNRKSTQSMCFRNNAIKVLARNSKNTAVVIAAAAKGQNPWWSTDLLFYFLSAVTIP